MLFRPKGGDGCRRGTCYSGRDHYLFSNYLDLHQDPVVKRVAESTLFPSFIGLVGYVWRVFVRPASVSRLKAITTAEEDSLEPEEHESANRTINNDSKPRRSDRDAGSQGVYR
jgi:hypothetical protein